MSDRWNNLSARAQRWTVVVGAVLAVMFVMSGLNSLGAKPSGPSLSSYATTDRGLAALESLLDGNDHPTDRLRVTLDEAALTPDRTVIAVGQSFTGGEQRALREFLNRGGRVITGGPEAERFLRTIDTDLRFEAGGAENLEVVADLPDVADVRQLRADGFGAWENAPGSVLLRGDGDVVAFSLSVGDGAVVALADPSILTNGLLAEADNAGFALGIVGAPGRRVAFAESGHGFGGASGLSAIPDRWKAALWFAAVAGLVGAVAAGKRFGPIDVEPEAPAPERIQYVGAVASTLSRSGDRDAAVAPLRARAATLLARRAGGRTVDDRDSLVAAAQRAGLSAGDARSLVDPVANDDDLLQLGRVVARLEEH
ncbi:MAG: hypothetical protein Q8K63_10415 [Acidimicrobiales bacterium]|nr:hypothetical protein [Acidimicrobiales bacterium]